MNHDEYPTPDKLRTFVYYMLDEERMKKEIQQYLEMPDKKLENIRKIYFFNCSVGILAVLMLSGFFLYFLYIHQTTTAILLLFGLGTVMFGSILSKQTLRYIEIIQELKKIKSNEGSSADG